MAYSAIPGNTNAQPGNIAPSVVSSFSPIHIGYSVNITSAKTLRVVFDVKTSLTSTLDKTHYLVSAVTFGAFIPEIIEIRQYELDQMQYEIVFSQALTLNCTYNLLISGIVDANGNNGVLPYSKNFTATVPDGAIATGAYFYTDAKLSIKFDRPVYPYTSSPNISLFETGNPISAVSCVVVPYTVGQPNNTVIIEVPVGAPSASSWSLQYDSVFDISQNSLSRNTIVYIPRNIANTLTYAVTNNISLVDAFATNFLYVPNAPDSSYSNLRILFNICPDAASVANESNWSIVQKGIHTSSDTLNIVTAAYATDQSSLETLISDIKTNFNSHIRSAVHHVEESFNVINGDPSNWLETTREIQSKYISHKLSDEAHRGADPIDPIFSHTVDSLSSAIVRANSIRDAYNLHIDRVDPPVSFIPLYLPNSKIDLSGSNVLNTDFCVSNPWSVDMRVQGISAKAVYEIAASNIMSYDGSSTLSTAPFLTKPAVHPSFLDNVSVNPDDSAIATTSNGLSVLNGFSISSDAPIFEYLFQQDFLSSRRHLAWLALSLGDAFERHRLSGPTVHFAPDFVDYAPTFAPTQNLDTLCNYVNFLKTQFMNHIKAKFYHYDKVDGFSVLDIEATDIMSLTLLLKSLYDIMNEHFENEFLHAGNDQYLISVTLNDSVKFKTGYQKDYENGDFTASWQSNVLDFARQSEVRASSRSNISVYSFGMLPYEASVVPISGIKSDPSGYFLWTDKVELYYSKRMKYDENSDLSPITISGLTITSRSYESPQKAVMTVTGMDNISYSVTSTGSKDLIGNGVP